jgi:hypothetical protein
MSLREKAEITSLKELNQKLIAYLADIYDDKHLDTVADEIVSDFVEPFLVEVLSEKEKEVGKLKDEKDFWFVKAANSRREAGMLRADLEAWKNDRNLNIEIMNKNYEKLKTLEGQVAEAAKILNEAEKELEYENREIPEFSTGTGLKYVKRLGEALKK